MEKCDLTIEEIVIGYMLKYKTYYCSFDELENYMIDLGFNAISNGYSINVKYSKEDFVSFVYTRLMDFCPCKDGLSLDSTSRDEKWLKSHFNAYSSGKRNLLSLTTKKEDDLELN